jgi:hypothetical protein
MIARRGDGSRTMWPGSQTRYIDFESDRCCTFWGIDVRLINLV